MFEYVLRLFILVPLIGAMAWGSIWLWRRVQSGLPAIPGLPVIPGLAGFTGAAKAERSARVVDVLSMGTSGKIAVIEFGDKELLVAVSRAQISLLSEREKGDFHA